MNNKERHFLSKKNRLAAVLKQESSRERRIPCRRPQGVRRSVIARLYWKEKRTQHRRSNASLQGSITIKAGRVWTVEIPIRFRAAFQYIAKPAGDFCTGANLRLLGRRSRHALLPQTKSQLSQSKHTPAIVSHVPAPEQTQTEVSLKAHTKANINASRRNKKPSARQRRARASCPRTRTGAPPRHDRHRPVRRASRLHKGRGPAHRHGRARSRS